MDLLWGLGGCWDNVEAIGQSRISQWIKGGRVKGGKQIRIFKTMKRTCQNSNLNPLWELVVARPTWSLHCVTALALRDRSDRLQSSTPTWSSSFTWWAFTPANLLIYCRLVYLHMWISPVWTLKFGCFTKQRNLFHHHFPLLQPWLKENYSCLFSCLFLWK